MATKAGRYDENLLQIAGSGTNVVALVGASVEVFNSDGVTAATLYDDRDKTPYSGTGSVVKPDAAGNLQFFADPGIYVLEISVDGTLARTDTVNVSVDGVEAADFPSLASNETVTGAWTFSTDPTLADGSSALSQTEGSAAYGGLADDETITGTWTFYTGVRLPGASGSGGLASDPASDYPIGLSYAAASTANGWPTNSFVFTVKSDVGRTVQFAIEHRTGDNKIYIRNENSDGTWTSWASINPARLGDGTAAAPAFSFSLDTDTGIYRPVADAFGLVTGGVERLRIQAGTQPGASLLSGQFFAPGGTGAVPAFSFANDPNTGIYRIATDAIAFATAGVTSFLINAAQNVYPASDGVPSLGLSSRRWKDVWAVNGTIQTSDINDKSDVIPITGTAALDRVLRTAANAIQFKWRNGKRTHAGFSAQGVGQEHGADTAAYIDPAVEANARTNPYAAADPTAEWYADYDDPAEAEAEWVEARDEFDAETQEMLAAPKGIRPAELIPDLYAAIAAQQQTITDLVARVAALEAHHA